MISPQIAFSDALVVDKNINKDTLSVIPYLEYQYSSNRDDSIQVSNIFGTPVYLMHQKIDIEKKYHYFQIKLVVETEEEADLVLQLVKLDYAKLRIFDNGILFREYQTGELIPYIKKSIPHNRDGHEEIRMKLPEGEYSLLLVLSDRSKKDLVESMSIISFENWKEVLHENLDYHEIAQGVFHGVLWAMILFFVYYYFITRDKSGLLFITSALFMSVFMLSSFGFIPPLFPSINPKYLTVFNHMIFLGSLFAFISFLGLYSGIDHEYPYVKKSVNHSKQVIIILFLISIVVLFKDRFLQWYYFSRTLTNSILAIVWIVHTIFMYLRAKEHKLIILASFIAIGGFITTLIYYQQNPEELSIYFPIETGYMLSLITISFVIVDRYRQVLENKSLVQEQLIVELKKNEELQRDQNERLENEVLRRTEEISSQNEELTQQQEELAAQRDTLENQSRLIEQKNFELQNYNHQLEDKVHARTNQLEQINSELVRQNQQLEQFSYILAHNLRSPVARLIGLTNLFNITDADDFNEIIERIASSAYDLNDVLKDVNTMLEVKSGEGPVKSKVSIKQLVDKCINRYKDQIENLGIEIKKQIDFDELVTINAYLESIILNLFSNAVKYRNPDNNPYISLSSRKVGKKVEIIVEDNGIGINLEENKTKLFGMYQRFHDHIEGKGLGLYLVKAQVETLRGEIQIKSELYKGTRFTILIPL